jgi:ribulose kinase
MRSHPAGGAPTSALHASIVQRIAKLRSVRGAQFAARLRVLPDFHGNRAPLAEPMSLGAVIGLSLDESFDGLCALYFRAAVAIAMRDRHILEALQAIGYDIAKVHFVGGHAKNPLLVELYADVSGVTLVASLAIDTTLLGDAMVAAVTAGLYPSLDLAAKAMASGRREHQPNLARQRDYDAEYRVFTELTKAVIEIERLAAK